MSTRHEQMVEHAWDKASLDFEFHRAIVKHRETFLADPHSDVHAVIAQYWTGRPIAVAQFWAIAQLRTLWREGLISYCNIDIGHEPGRDRDLERHRSLLQGEKEHVSMDGLREVLRIEGDVENGAGAGAEDDGTLTLLNDAKFDVCFGSVAKPKKTGVKRVLAGACFPLEIGYTSASRTYLHLIQEGCVARWPYGKTSLSLLQADLPHFNPVRKKSLVD
jgi:hypothetical protein